MDSSYCEAGCALRGLPDGCIPADMLVKVYCREPLDQFVQQFPSVLLDVDYDDFSMSSYGALHAVAADLVRAARAFCPKMQKLLLAVLATRCERQSLPICLNTLCELLLHVRGGAGVVAG